MMNVTLSSNRQRTSVSSMYLPYIGKIQPLSQAYVYIYTYVHTVYIETIVLHVCVCDIDCLVPDSRQMLCT